MTKSVLVTGGAGYIGSHTVKALLDSGYDVHVLDNLASGTKEAVDSRAKFTQMDVYQKEALKNYFRQHKIDAVMHCAGEIKVGESMENPIKYFEANVTGMHNVLTVMQEEGIKKVLFSSTASVYGNNCGTEPATEETQVAPVNPYAETKYMGERMIHWFKEAYGFDYVIFRYFNVAGAAMDASNGLRVKQPTHIIPNINKTALGQNDMLKIFGEDYDTPDGSCIRDYIHVLDLAAAHVAGFDYIFSENATSEVFNLGTEKGYSVKEIFAVAEKVIEKDIPVEIVDRRPGDPASVLAKTDKVKQYLGWETKYSLEEIILSDYNWRVKSGDSIL